MFCRDFSMTSLHNSCSLHNESAHKKKKEKSQTEEASQKCAPRIVVSCRHKISYRGNKLLFSYTVLFPPAKILSKRVESTASKQENVLVPLISEICYCNCLVFLLQ